MFRATESGYNEFRNQLIRRVIQSLVDDCVSPDELDDELVKSTIGLDLSELYWDRIPEEHYHFIASVAGDDEFYVPDNVSFTQPAEDVIEQIAFAAVVEDTYDEFNAVEEHYQQMRLIEIVHYILETHDWLDELIDEEYFDTPSDAVDAFYTWLPENSDEAIGLSEFSERNIRRQEALPIRLALLTDLTEWMDAEMR